MKIFAITCIATLSLFGFASSHAGADKIPVVTIKYGDLDLARADGMKALYGRLEHAAREVCAPLDMFGSVAPLYFLQPYKGCLSKAVRDAVDNINNPQFSDYAAGKNLPVQIKLASR